MENSCEELCLIWGQREQDEVYSTSEIIEDYSVHLPAPAANVFIGLRFYFGGVSACKANLQPCQLLAVCPLTLPGSYSPVQFWRTTCKEPVTASFSTSQEDRRNSELWGPCGPDTHESLSGAAIAFIPSCFPSVHLGPSCCMNIANCHQNLWSQKGILEN